MDSDGPTGPMYVLLYVIVVHPSHTPDGWTAAGGHGEFKSVARGQVLWKCRSAAPGRRGRFVKYNITGYDRFVGILVDPKVTDSVDWSQWVRYALDVTASIPQPFDECAVAFQQFRPESTRRLAGFVRRTDGRGMEIVTSFVSEMIADEPSLLEDVDFL